MLCYAMLYYTNTNANANANTNANANANANTNADASEACFSREAAPIRK